MENVSTGRVPDEELFLSNLSSPEAETQTGKWLCQNDLSVSQPQSGLPQCGVAITESNGLSRFLI